MNIKKPENWTDYSMSGYELPDFVKAFSDERIGEFYNYLKNHIESPESRSNDKYYNFMKFMLDNYPYNLLNAILRHDGRTCMTLIDFEACIQSFFIIFWKMQLDSDAEHFNFKLNTRRKWQEVMDIYIEGRRKIDKNYNYNKDKMSIIDASPYSLICCY